MISECEEHGYFRDKVCLVCGKKGRFLMSDFEVEKLGRTMAAVLRHGKFDLEMDFQGFIDMRNIVSVVRDNNSRMKWLRSRHVEALALTDPKGRYQIRGHTVRATYGHTIKIDLRLPMDRVPMKLYYPVSVEEMEVITETGIRPTDRAMVHLSATYSDAVNAGRAHVDDPLVLEVDTRACADSGHPIGRAARTVYLCDMVPADCVEEIESPENDEQED